MGVKVTGVAEVTKMLKGIRGRQKNLKPFLEREAKTVDEAVAKAWSSRTSPSGDRWAPYKDPARTGGSLRSESKAKGSRRKLTWKGSHIAAFHYFGTKFMPPRNAIPFERSGSGFAPAKEWLDPHLARMKAWIVGTDGENVNER